MNRVEVTQYQGKKIIKLNFSDLKSKEEIESVILVSKPIIRSSPNSVCTLTNVKGMFFNNEIKDLFSEFTNGNKKYVIAGAVYGASGLHKIIINGINKFTGRKIKAFDDAESAKEWLVKQN